MAEGNNGIYTNLAQGGWKFQLIGGFFFSPFFFVTIFKIPTRQEYECEALPGCCDANTLHYNLQEKEREKGGLLVVLAKSYMQTDVTSKANADTVNNGFIC